MRRDGAVGQGVTGAMGVGGSVEEEGPNIPISNPTPLQTVGATRYDKSSEGFGIAAKKGSSHDQYKSMYKILHEQRGGAWAFADSTRDFGMAIGQGIGDVGSATCKRSGQTISNDDLGTSLHSASFES